MSQRAVDPAEVLSRFLDVFVAGPLGKPIPARADIGAKAVSDNRLAVDADGIPHPSHANIVGWPGSRSAQKLVAIRLAEAAVCVFRSR